MTERVSKIKFIQSKKESSDDCTFDALNAYISGLDSCRELKFLDYFYIDNEEQFQIADHIFCKVSKLEKNESVDSYSIEIFSPKLMLGELKSFITDIKRKYLYERNNKLDNLKFYFDEHHVALMRNADNSIKFSTAPPELSFTMTQFHTNKSLKNVFGQHLKTIKERMDLFCNNRDWYTEKGIPYTLGILLHGPPGTGKTSIIKAIAKDTNRHIFNIKLHKDTTKTQLNNLFFNENVKVLRNGKTEVYNIPLDERLYVMEDVDCENDILLDRRYKDSSTETDGDGSSGPSRNSRSRCTPPDRSRFENSFEYRYEPFFNSSGFSDLPSVETSMPVSHSATVSGRPGGRSSHIESGDRLSRTQSTYPKALEEDTSEQVTLSHVLNILDGILETPGRILILTSNYPEKLDKALLRPGRIDINQRVGYCDVAMIQEMYQFFYNLDTQVELQPIQRKITPAQLNKILLDNFNNNQKAVQDINAYISRPSLETEPSLEATTE